MFRNGEDVYAYIEVHLSEERREIARLDAGKLDRIESLIRAVREHDDYKTLLDQPLEKEKI